MTSMPCDVALRDLNDLQPRWTVRDLDSKVMRAFKFGGGWTVARDHVIYQ